MRKLSLLFAALLVAGTTIAENFKKVTTAPTDWSGEYALIAEGEDANYAFGGVDQALSSEVVSINNGIITDYMGPTIVVASLEDGGYSIAVKSGTNDGKYISTSLTDPTYSNTLKFRDTPQSLNIDIADFLDGSVEISLTCDKDALADSVVILRFNSGTSQLRFRFYKGISSTILPVYLYKLYDGSGGEADEETPEGAITYVLYGGVTNDYGWQNKGDMFAAFMTDAGVTDFETLDYYMAQTDPLGAPNICAKLTNAAPAITMDKWAWLKAYIEAAHTAQAAAGASTLNADGTGAAWRYAVGAFFISGQRTNWPKSANFEQLGQDDSYIPAWEHAYVNPIDPNETFALNAPYKEGCTFDGWYANADFSGKQVLSVDQTTTGTLYAKWQNMTVLPLPFVEDFNDLEEGVPDDWDNSEYTCGEDERWHYTATGRVGAGLVFNAYAAAEGTTATLKTPAIVNGAETNLTLSYYLKSGSSATLDVYVSTDGGLTFPQHIVTAQTAPTTWTLTEILFTVAANASVMLKFVATSDYGFYELYLDDVSVVKTATSANPKNLRLAASTVSSATLAWTAGGEETSWELKYKLGTNELRTVVVNNTPEYTITGLEANTSYTLSSLALRAICSATDSSYVVSFNDITFRTPCGVIDLPYTNSFDQTDFPGDCWSASYHLAGTAGGWSRTTSGAYSGAGCAKLADATVDNRNVIASPFFHSDAPNTLRVSFWMYRAADYYTSEDEGVRVWVNTIATDTLGGTPLIHVARAASVGGDGIKVPAVASAGWYKYIAEIPVAGDVCLLFEGISEYGNYSLMDEVTIEAIPTCERPDAVMASAASATEVAVEITDNDSTHTAWEVVVGAVGFDPATATPIAVNSKNATVTAPFTMVGLSSYEAYVRAVCAADDKSNWTGPSTFIYTDWSPLASGITFTSSGLYPWTLTHYAGEYYATSGNQHIVSSVSDLVASLVVPENTKTTVSFDWSTEAYSYYEGFVIYIDEANPTLTNYDTDFGKQAGSYNDYHVEGSYNVAFTTPGTHTIRFRHLYNGTYASSSYGDSQSKLLAISRRDVSCVEPSVFNMGTITSTSAVLNWNNTGADNWEVAVFDANQSTINTAEAIVYQTVTGESTLTIEGLTPNTAYYAYVRSNCGTSPSDWSAAATFRTECAARAIPFEESFEVAGADFCWEIVGDAVTKSVAATGFDATKSLQVYNDSVAGLLVSPRFDVTSLAEYEVNLAINLTAKRYHNATIKPLTIGVMTDPSDASTYIDLGDINIPSANGWKEYRFSLADLATPDYADWANAQYVVVSMSDSATYLFDAITVASPSSCPKPTALDVEAIGENSVVSWVSDATAHYAEIALGDSVVFAGNVQNPFTPTLDANTTYKVRVRAVCGEDISAWTPWVIFKIPCALAALPYSENFDSYTNAPTAAYAKGTTTVVPDCWTLLTESTNMISVANSSSNSYVRANSGSNVFVFSGLKEAYLLLPTVSGADGQLMLSVDSRQESTKSSGTFVLGYVASAGDAGTFVAVDTVSKSTSWLNSEAIIPAAAYVNPAIRFIPGSSASYFAAIDNVIVKVAPTCPKPTNVRIASFNADSAVVAWNAGDEETEWELIYKLGNQAADTVVVNGASNYAVKNLAPNTSYNLNVLSLRAICSATDNSDVATGSLSFKTPCATEVLPMEEDFSNGISDCWTRFANLAFTDGVSTATASTATSGWNKTSKVFTNEVKVNIYGTTCKYWLVSPSFRVNDAAATLAFDMALTQYNATTAVTAGQQAYDKFIVAISTDGSTWTLANATVWSNEADAAHVFDSISNTGENVVLPLGAYVGQTIRVAFYAESTVSGGDNDFHLANIVISEPVECDRPAAAAASDITQTSATITITDEGGSAWEYVINDQEATPTAVSTASFELTGLSAMTDYTVYVRRNCGNGNVSAWRSVTFMTACGVMTVPFVEDFENITSISGCWHQEQTVSATGSGTDYGNNCWKINTSGSATTAHASTHSLQLQDTRDGTHTILALPAVHSDSVNALEFTFWMYRTTGVSKENEGVKVWVNNAPSLEGATALMHVTRCGGVEADSLKVNPISAAGWYEYSCVLPMAGDIYVILEGISQYGAASYVDDIKIAPAPTCRKPTDLLFRETTSTTVMIEIDDEDGSAWEYAVDYTDNPVAVSDPVFTLTGLTPGTDYTVYARRVCSADDRSEWISKDAVTTCVPVDAMYEDVNNSDTRMQGWVRLYTSSTSYPLVYSTSGVDGTPCWYVYGNTSTPYNGIYAMREITGDISSYRFMVDAKKSTATEAGDIIIGVADAVGAEITYVDTITPNSTTYTTYVADFTSYTGTGKFPILVMSNLQTTVYLDNFVVEPIPSCDRPVSVVASNATAVSIDVVINDTVDAHTAWEAVIVDHGANPSTGTSVALNSKTATLEGAFTTTVAYDLYVRAVCNANDKSNWTGPATFKFVDFSAVTTIPLAAVGDYPWTVNSSNHLESTNQGKNSTTSDFEATFEVPEGNVATVSFQYSVESEGTSSLYDYLCFYIDEANPSTSNYNSTFGKKGGASGASGTGTFTLTEGTHKVLFRYFKDSSSSTGADAAQIWNFAVTYNSFYRPINLGVDSLAATSAKLTWSSGSDAVQNEVRLMSNDTAIYSSTTDNILNVTGLTPEMDYQFRVRSFAASGDSTAWSTAFVFTTPALYPKPEYTVSASASNGSVTGTGTYEHGMQAELTVVPQTGYHFVKWSDGSTDNPRTVTVTGTATYSAVCEINEYTVSASASNGSVTGIGTYEHGMQAELTVVPAIGYHFVKWSDGNTDNPRMVTVTEAATYSAVCEINVYAVSATASNGSVTGTGDFEHGMQAELTVVPQTGYHFVKWSDGSTDNPRMVTVTGAATYSAVCEINVYAVSATASNGSVTGTGTYEHGMQTELTVVPQTGYHFVKWSDGNTDNPRMVTVTESVTYSAVCEINEYTVSATASNGSVSGTGTYGHGLQAELTVVPAIGYHFVKWSDGSTDNPRTVTVTEAATYSAVCEINEYIVSASASNGSVTGTGTYEHCMQAELTVVPLTGYHFVKWSDGNTDNPRTVTVTEAVTYSAVCEIDRFILTLEAEHGTTMGSGTYDYGTSVEMTATADQYYRFVQWSDGNTDNPRNIVVNGNITLTALFELRLGDANNDEVVDVQDVSATVEHILDHNPEPFVFLLADVDEDQVVDVCDIAQIVNIILYGTPERQMARRAPAYSNQQPLLTGNSIAAIPSSDAVLTLSLADAGYIFTALQLDMELPEGLTLKSASLGSRTLRHTLSSETLPDGTVRLLLYSMGNAALTAEEGSVLQLVLTADLSYSQPSAEIRLTGITAATTTGQKIRLGDTAVSVICPVATGVVDASASGEQGAEDSLITEKFFRDGILYIRRGAHLYDANGRMIE